MKKNLTRQSLPEEDYLVLLGAALCTFNSNNQFVIENMLRSGYNLKDWYHLIDLPSGKLFEELKKTNLCEHDNAIQLFHEIIKMRNRIIHSFQITENGKQRLGTKEKINDGNHQDVITEEYLRKFLKMNERLHFELHSIREHL